MNEWWKEASHQADVLAIGAHPDDAELLAGGSIAKMASKGLGVIIADATHAELSTNGNVKTRKVETENASKVLKILNRVNLGFRDGYLNREPLLLDTLVKLIREIKPKIVLAPPIACRHPDHEALGKVLKEAVFYAGLKKYLPEIAYCSRPKLINYFEIDHQSPNFCIDISEYYEIKKKAILCYETQFSTEEGYEKTFINKGFLERLERHSIEWGEKLGVAHAEPFLSAEPVLLDNFLF